MTSTPSTQSPSPTRGGGDAQRGTQVVTVFCRRPPRRFAVGTARRRAPQRDGDDCGARAGGATPAEAMIRILPEPCAGSATAANCPPRLHRIDKGDTERAHSPSGCATSATVPSTVAHPNTPGLGEALLLREQPAALYPYRDRLGLALGTARSRCGTP